MAFFNSAVTVLQTLGIALGPVSASGEPSTCWRATATTTPVPMLMYHKVTEQQIPMTAATILYKSVFT